MQALKIKQARASKLGPIDFVDNFAIAYAVDALSDIKRSFKNIGIVGNKARLWSEGLGNKNVILINESDSLNFNGEKFDLLIHALSLHRCNDPVGQLIQARNALQPDGLLLALFLGDETLSELRASFEAAEIQVDNGVSPRVAPMIGIRDAGNLLVRSGFALNVADKTDLQVSYKSPIDLLYDLRGMAETSIMVARQKSFLKRRTFNKMLEIYSNEYKMLKGNGVKATFQLLCLTGWAPAINQQQPLKPGSATHQFSEVLDTYKL